MRLKEFANVASWKTIAARNAIANPDVIKPGQVLDVGDGVVYPKVQPIRLNQAIH